MKRANTMTTTAQKYTCGYKTMRGTKKITDIYIPSHNIIFNYEIETKQLNVFHSTSPRNFIEHSFKQNWSDKFLEDMKTDELLKEMYDRKMESYRPPTPTQMTDIELPLDYVDMLAKIAKMNGEIKQIKDQLTVSSKAYLR